MSDNFRKFNQESSTVTRNELQQLGGSTPMRTSVGTAMDPASSTLSWTETVTCFPDFSEKPSPLSSAANPAPPLPVNSLPVKSTPVKPAAPDARSTHAPKADNYAIDDYIRLASREAQGGEWGAGFELRPKREEARRATSFQLSELVDPAPTRRAAPQPAQPVVAPSSEPKRSVPMAAHSASRTQTYLGQAIETSFVDADSDLWKRLIQRQTLVGTQLLLIADVDQPQRAASVAAQITLELAERTGKRVLLIDADTAQGKLSRTLFPDLPRGLTEIVRGECRWNECLNATEKGALEFLAVGCRPLDFTQTNDLTREHFQELLGQLRKDYDFVCVTLGTAFENSLAAWGHCCDATYLTIDPLGTSRALAKAAVRELQRSGARVEGCIATLAEVA